MKQKPKNYHIIFLSLAWLDNTRILKTQSLLTYLIHRTFDMAYIINFYKMNVWQGTFFSFLLTFRKLFWFCIVWQRCQIFFWPISHKNSQKIQITKRSVATLLIMFLTWQILKPCPHTQNTWLDICLKKVHLVKYWLRICPNRSQVVYLTRNIVILSICSSLPMFFQALQNSKHNTTEPPTTLARLDWYNFQNIFWSQLLLYYLLGLVEAKGIN